MSVAAPPLWDHQKEAVRNLKKEFASHPRATNVMACGTGKTRVGAEMARLVSPSEPVLIVVPTLDLVAQTLASWAQACGRSQLGRIIAVCGDKEVMHRDDAQQLGDWDVAVTSDPIQLAELLRRRGGRCTVTITYQSLPKLVEAFRFPGVMPWKLVIVDEAHRSAGRKGREWSMIHDDLRIPAIRRLYMTATPRLLSVRDDSLAGEVVSMDDEKVFGRVAHRLSFAEARRRRLLADYRVIVSVVTDEEMHRLANSPQGATYLQVGASAMSASMLARQIAILRSAREFDVRRVLTYHNRVADCRWFAQTLPAADALLGPGGDLTTGFVHGSQNRRERRRELGKLADPRLDRVIISNARVLSEGYDSPGVGGLGFVDTRKSTIDTVQAVGRALRLDGDRDKTAYIFVPVLLEPGQDPVSALQSSAYGPVWRVVSALAAHDETLSEELDVRRRALGRSNGRSGNNPLSAMPDWLQFSGVPVPEQFARAITVHAVRSTTASWEEHLGAAAAYAEKHGDLLAPRDHITKSGLPLGQWLCTARNLYQSEALSPARVSQLNEIGMVWDVPDEEFRRRIEAAAAYRAENGHLRIPLDHITTGPRPIALGKWIRSTRSRRHKLTSEQTRALDELGMVWSVPDEEWKEGISAARSYHERHGDLRVPADHVEKSPDHPEGYPLGHWIAAKRDTKKSLAAEKKDELTGLGMVWHMHEDTWQRHFQAAQALQARQGNLEVTRGHTEKMPDGQEVSLGSWLMRQRAEMKDGTLSAERRKALEDLGMEAVHRHEKLWEKGMAFARLYHQEHKSLDVLARAKIAGPDGEDFDLGGWISKVRDRRAKGKLPKERVEELDELGMIWDVPEHRWQRFFAAAQEFYRTHGHIEVPYAYVTAGPEKLKLGSWTSRQREERKRDRISAQRIEELNKLGMRWT